MQSSMQSGMMPPLPGLNFPPPSLPQTPQAPATPIAFPPQFPPQLPQQIPSHSTAAPIAPVERVQEVADSDKEDGEVSEVEAVARTPAGTIARQRYLEPPRSAPQPIAAPSRVEEAYNPDKPAAGQSTPQRPTPQVAPPAKTVMDEQELLQQQREEAKQFIRLLNANNVGYHALAKENVDVELLRGLYRSMNLPSEPEPIPLPKTNGTAAAKPSTESDPLATTATPSTSQKAVPAVSTNVAAASVTGAAASPVDRKDYLARLQAAKLARQSGPAKASPPQKSPPAAVASPVACISTPQASMTPTKKPPVTDEQKARQTELIKQRLEALKAQSKQNAAASINTAQKPAPSQQPHIPATGGATQQTHASGFSSLPGLFMNGSSSVGNGASTPSRQPQGVPQKRPLASDTETSTPRGSVTPYNRPLAQSPSAHQEDSMIIEVSDDESNGSDMDIDDDQAQAPLTIRQAPVSIPGFPPRQAPVPVASSTVSTPGPQTPASLARTGELSTKEQELAALKLTLKKKLAEQKRIREAADAATAAASAAAASAATSDSTASKHEEAPSSPATTSPQPRTGAPATMSSRDRKRRRRTEIEEQLPTLDDEIASNEAEMARLAKDLERLRANNERIMQDKQRLTKELEDLGIDTEGMSHADMRATKDEIERAMSPEVDAEPQPENTLLQGVPPQVDSSVSRSAPTQEVALAETTTALPPVSTPVNSQDNPPQYGFLPGLGQAAPPVTAPVASHPSTQPVSDQVASSSQYLQSGSDLADAVESSTHDARLNDRASATPMDDDEDFYSPPPVEIGANAEPVVAEAPEHQFEQSVADVPSPSEEGEVAMSESSEDEDDEEEYEPEELVVEEAPTAEPVVEDSTAEAPTTAVEPHSQQTQLPEPPVEASQSIGPSQVSTEDEEAYEPPDVDEEMTEVAPVLDNAQIEASSPGDADDGAMDIATSSSEDSDDSESDSADETSSDLDDSAAQADVAQQDTNIADDLAPELQPEASVTVVPVTAQAVDVSLLPLSKVPLTLSGTCR